ncbi:hypothetical protein EVAR_89680_1 [Eumeta japonica]|uniref:Uncharacterized protein n=1 Tax=Eumeta variegata TaxID=151549 RepID=A0A4C1WWE8_EUMVA|nr:hypothetical protein EVAR_89680_1 [Eumeta japonica]
MADRRGHHKEESQKSTPTVKVHPAGLTSIRDREEWAENIDRYAYLSCLTDLSLVISVEKGMSRWFGYLERMNESRLTKQIYRVNVYDKKAPKRNRSARHEPVCMPISLSLSLALSLSALRRANCARVEGTRAFHFLCLSLALGGLTMPVEGRVPLTRSHCERIT